MKKFATTKGEVVIQNEQTPSIAPAPAGGSPEIIQRFVYLGSCVVVGREVLFILLNVLSPTVSLWPSAY